MSFITKKRFYISLLFLLLLLLTWLNTSLNELFHTDFSTVIRDRNGTLLRAFLTEDEQFRFPLQLERKLPKKYKTAVIHYEDRKFYKHKGINLTSLGYSLYLNLKKGKRVRGGSTITMQVVRLSQKNSRTYFNKIKEIATALKLDHQKEKDEILHLYATHAPMGGNIVGVPAACYRYFGKPMEQITWSEAALLAVLPNAPGLINTQKNRSLLKIKRDCLLRSLHESGAIDAITLETAILEAIPITKPLPFKAPHFTNMVKNQRTTQEVTTTLDLSTQQTVEREVTHYHPTLLSLGIRNCAVLVCDRQTSQIRAYVGSANFHNKEQSGNVDGILAKRSPGSLIKPILTTSLFDRGPFTPKSQIYDIPTFYGSYTPLNASKEFYGLVSLEDALIKSLNVPFIRLLNYHGIEDFYLQLKSMGIHTLNKPYNSYGLPLILGAFETSLWDLSGLYLTVANSGIKSVPQFLPNVTSDTLRVFSPAATQMTTKILQNLIRPGQELYWEEFNRQLPVAWKTGTSYGRKDGWSIGYTDQLLVAVWTGNFSGEGNASIGGSVTAAPLMFSIMNSLTSTEHNNTDLPLPDSCYKELLTCTRSGYKAGRECDTTKIILVPNTAGRKEKICPFHKRYHIDPRSGKSTCSLCWDEHVEKSFFLISPPAKEQLKRRGFEVDSIPAHKEDCQHFDDVRRMEIIYPQNGVTILTPRNTQGGYEKTVFKASHQRKASTLFWYLDAIYLGESTLGNHTLAVDLQPGDHTITIEDEEGFKRQIFFTSYRNQ